MHIPVYQLLTRRAGIPTLVLVDEENKIISRNARFVVANDVEGKVWTSRACLDLLYLHLVTLDGVDHLTLFSSVVRLSSSYPSTNLLSFCSVDFAVSTVHWKASLVVSMLLVHSVYLTQFNNVLLIRLTVMWLSMC